MYTKNLEDLSELNRLVARLDTANVEPVTWNERRQITKRIRELRGSLSCAAVVSLRQPPPSATMNYEEPKRGSGWLYLFFGALLGMMLLVSIR
ncbi:hypothetical protein [Paraburkholderia kururiensis]|nr:hypothetical protein [Paraburkholderia kururiensis]